jgi:hypothetical protein
MMTSEESKELFDKQSLAVSQIKTITKIDIDDLEINQKVKIDFIPYSQRYIWDLYPKIGTIVNYKKEKCYNKEINQHYNVYDIKIINQNGEIEDLLHDGVSYLGYDLGYCYTIYLI